MNTCPVPDEEILSSVWGRRFGRVVAVRKRSNTIIELEERGDDGPVRRFLRLGRSWEDSVGRSPGWSDEEVGWELELLRSVTDRLGVAVARPLPGADGRFLRRQQWDGVNRHACLFEAAPGRELEQDGADLERLSRALAELQAAMSGCGEPPPGRCLDVAAICRDASLHLSPHGSAAAALAVDIGAVAATLEEAFARSALPCGPCHGDAHVGNARLDGDRITFFDFDECVFGPLALDLAVMAAWLRPEPNGRALWDALLCGYAGCRPLTPGETAALPMLVLLAELRIAHNLARYWSMPERLWEELRARIGSRIDAFRLCRDRFDAVQRLF